MTLLAHDRRSPSTQPPPTGGSMQRGPCSCGPFRPPVGQQLHQSSILGRGGAEGSPPPSPDPPVVDPKGFPTGPSASPEAEATPSSSSATPVQPSASLYGTQDPPSSSVGSPGGVDRSLHWPSLSIEATQKLLLGYHSRAARRIAAAMVEVGSTLHRHADAAGVPRYTNEASHRASGSGASPLDSSASSSAPSPTQPRDPASDGGVMSAVVAGRIARYSRMINDLTGYSGECGKGVWVQSRVSLYVCYPRGARLSILVNGIYSGR